MLTGRCRSAPPPFELAVQRLTPPPPIPTPSLPQQTAVAKTSLFLAPAPSETLFQTGSLADRLPRHPPHMSPHLSALQTSQSTAKTDALSAPARFPIFMGAIKRRLSAFNWIPAFGYSADIWWRRSLKVLPACMRAKWEKAACSASPVGKGVLTLLAVPL